MRPAEGAVRVLLFAGLAELAGRRELLLPVGQGQTLDVAALQRAVVAAEPALAGRRFRVALNRRYAQPHESVRPGDEIALIPPVSGG